MSTLERLTALYDAIEKRWASCDDLCRNYETQMQAVTWVARQVLSEQSFNHFFQMNDAYRLYADEVRGSWDGDTYTIEHSDPTEYDGRGGIR